MRKLSTLASTILMAISLLTISVYATGITPNKPQASQSSSSDGKGSCCNYKTRYFCTVVSGGCKKCEKSCSITIKASEVASPSECDNKGGTTNEVQTPASLIDNRTFNYIHYSTDYADGSISSDLGCGSCGAAPTAKTSKTLPPLGLIRYHRFRNITEQSSFGGGVFSNWDVTLTLMKDANGKNLIDISNPNDLNTRRLFPQQGVFRDTFARSYDGMTLFKADGVTTTIDILQADTAVLKTRSGRTFTFQLFHFDEVSKMGRLWKITDRNNYGFTIDYEIDDYAAYDPNDPNYDPYAKFRMESITDPNHRVMSFTYLQEGGVFVKRKGFYPIHTVTTPSGNVITYIYGSTTDSGLEAVNHADGTTSTFTAGTYDGQSYVHFFEASEHHNSKRKTVYLTDNFVGGITSDGLEYYNSSSLLVNFATRGPLTIDEENPTEEVTYIGMVDGHIMHRKIYEGGQRLKWVDIDIARYYKNWDITGDPTTGADAFTGTREPTFEKGEFKFYAANRQGRPPVATDKKGVKNTFLYNTNASMTKKNYPDGTFEEWDYNEFEQPIRYRDRLGRVTLNHYDERGNHLASVVGVKAVSATPDTERISGLVYNLYDGQWNQLPNFSSLTPVDTGVTSLFEVDDTDRDHFYGMTFEGDLDIATAGDYIFTTGSDDGSKLFIDDVLVVDNDGTHALTEVDSVPVTLTAGYHKIRVEFFERSGQQKLFVYYNGPDSGNLKSLIPDTALSHMNTGIQETDTLTAETAVIVKEYYPEGHDHQFLIKYEYDAFEFPNDGTAITNYTSLINYVKSTSTKRKEFQYNDDHQLAEIIEPDDVGTGYHTAWSFRYDSAKRLFKSIEAASSFVDEAVDSPNRRYTARYYDNRDRLITLEYSDGSTETFTYGTGENANQIVQQKDRNDNITTFVYDDYGRPDTVTKATNSSDPDITKYSYLDGTDRIVSMEINGNLTTYTYDYRNRSLSTNVIADDNSTLITSNTYIDNKLFCKEDPYGRKTYYNYRSSDSSLIRTIKGNYPSYTLASFNAVASEDRSFSENATHIITDFVSDAAEQIIEKIDGKGISYRSFYNTRGWLVKEVKAVASISSITEYEYDAVGKQIEVRHPRFFDITDAEGYQQCATRNVYSRRNKLIETIEAYYSTLPANKFFTYYNDGKQATFSDFKGNVTEKIWKVCCGRLGVIAGPTFTDKDGNLKKRVDIRNYDYYGNNTHNAILSWNSGVPLPQCCYRDPLNSLTIKEVTRRYDSRHRVIAETKWLEPLGYVDPTNVPIGTDANETRKGLTTRFIYYDELNSNPELIPIITKLSEDGINFSTDTGSAKVTINPMEEVAIEVYDGIGREVAKGKIEKSSWQPNNVGTLLTWETKVLDIIESNSGLLISESLSSLNFSNKIFTDGSERTTKFIDAQLKEHYFKYDNNNNVLSYIDPNGNGKSCTYDDLNREISYQDSRGHTREKSYNLNNSVIRELDGHQNAEAYTYNARDLLINITNRINEIISYEYDANKNIIAIWDENQYTSAGVDYSKATRYKYDNRNILLATAYPGHPVGTSGLADSFIDLNHSITSLNYDLTTRITDGLNRKVVHKDQLGDTINYKYDMASRLLYREYRNDGDVIESIDSFNYDASSRILVAYKERYNNSVIFEYDSIGRKVKETIKLGVPDPQFVAPSFTTECNYDSDNRVDTYIYSSSNIVDVDYDNRNQLTNVKFNSSDIITSSYDDGMREKTRIFGNGLSTTFGYYKDNTKKLISVDGKADLSFSYTHDANKNILTETSTGSHMGAYSWTSTFDDIDRVETYNRNNGESQNWDLDPLGNWLTTDGQYGGFSFSEDRTNEHDDTNQLLGITPAGSSRIPLAYDTKGNLIQDESGAVLEWDIDNHLKSHTGLHTVNFEYDALGRRLSKFVTGTSKTLYINHGNRVLEEYSQNGTTYNLERSYLFGTYVDDIVAKVENNLGNPTIQYYHSDRQFNVRGLSDSSGAIVEFYAYSPYGKQTIMNSTGTIIPLTAISNNYGFTGRYLDQETGLNYFRSRYFSCELGRFINRDSIGYLDGMNLYAGFFASGFNLDPSGNLNLVQVLCIFAIIAILVALVLPTYMRAKNRGRAMMFSTEIKRRINNGDAEVNKEYYLVTSTTGVNINVFGLWEDFSENAVETEIENKINAPSGIEESFGQAGREAVRDRMREIFLGNKKTTKVGLVKFKWTPGCHENGKPYKEVDLSTWELPISVETLENGDIDIGVEDRKPIVKELKYKITD